MVSKCFGDSEESKKNFAETLPFAIFALRHDELEGRRDPFERL